MFKWLKGLFAKPKHVTKRKTSKVALSTVDAIRSDYAAGMVITDLCRKYRMGHPRIRRICKTLNRERKTGYTFARVRPDEIVAINQFVGQGNSIAAASRKFRRSQATIKKYCTGGAV